MKSIFRISIFLICLFIAKSPILAVDFKFDYDVYYNVQTTGVTHVKQNVTLTNLTTNYYARNFVFNTSSTNLTNIKASDSGGNIQVDVNSNNGQTEINLPFNVRSVGIGKTFQFSFEYDNRDITTNKGTIWEIIIPGIDKKEEINSYNIHIDTPLSFGQPSYISPPPNQQGFWTLDDLKGGGIKAAYGNIQHFTFNLIYNLKNDQYMPLIKEIALPPETAFQHIIISHISEIPQSVIEDDDGNWIAKYKLAGHENKRISVEGHALVATNAKKSFKNTLTESEKQIYTQEQKYWEQTPEIKQIAANLNTPKDIYDYVVNRLKYNYTRVKPGIERFGASEALRNPDQAVCMEFSDLFVALARTKGIPAREIHGFAYTDNSRLQPISLATDILHAWVEYYDYDQGFWVPIDPTWADTTLGVDYFSKLDYNHLTFAILGKDSDYPYPAGSNPDEDSNRNVFVDFGTSLPNEEHSYDIFFKMPPLSFSGIVAKGEIIVKNTGNTIINTENLNLLSKIPVSIDKQSIKNIPPFGSISIPFSIKSTLDFMTNDYSLVLTLEENTHNTNFRLYAAYILVIPILIILILLFVILKNYAKRHH